MAIINGTNRNDRLTSSGTPDQIFGNGGNDILNGGAADDDLSGGNGNDVLNGNGGNDLMDGGVGNDVLNGGAGSNQLFGGDGNDRLVTNGGTDTLVGGAGTDTFNITLGTAYIGDLGNGADILKVAAGATADAVLSGAWKATAATAINGTAHLTTQDFVVNLAAARGIHGFSITDTGHVGNTLTGSAKADVIHAGGGNDSIIGFVGADTVDGGAGIDTLKVGAGTNAALTTATDAQIANVETVQATAAATINLSTQSEGFTIIGSVGVDKLTGGAGADTINGGLGKDTINGGGGNDVINGGKGADVLSGGSGSDTFVFTAGDAGTAASTLDKILDYTKGAVGTGDLIDYSATLVIGGSNAAATAAQASIDQTTGVASFFAGSGKSLADALRDIATSFTANGNAAGEFAFFQVNGTGNEYLFVSDGVAGVGANDVVIQLVGVSSVTSIDLAGGNLTITG